MPSVLLKGKNELLSYFGVPDVRYQPFETYYTIRTLDEGCLEGGDKLFRSTPTRLYMRDVQYREYLRGEPIKIDHYNLKGYFYNTADFGISYTPSKERKGDVKTSIKFRVKLRGVKIGGSVTYADLGLENDEDVAMFVNIFSGLRDIRPVEEAVVFITNALIKNAGDRLYAAMAREIQEESTPDGSVAKSIDEIVKTLRLVEFSLKKSESWQTIVKFDFESDIKYKKVREMDDICCLLGGDVKHVYYIYDNNKRIYVTQPPYKLPPESLRPIVPMSISLKHMKSFSPARSGEVKGISSSYLPVNVHNSASYDDYMFNVLARSGIESGRKTRKIKRPGKKGGPTRTRKSEKKEDAK